MAGVTWHELNGQTSIVLIEVGPC